MWSPGPRLLGNLAILNLLYRILSKRAVEFAGLITVSAMQTIINILFCSSCLPFFTTFWASKLSKLLERRKLESYVQGAEHLLGKFTA